MVAGGGDNSISNRRNGALQQNGYEQTRAKENTQQRSDGCAATPE